MNDCLIILHHPPIDERINIALTAIAFIPHATLLITHAQAIEQELLIQLKHYNIDHIYLAKGLDTPSIKDMRATVLNDSQIRDMFCQTDFVLTL